MTHLPYLLRIFRKVGWCGSRGYGEVLFCACMSKDYRVETLSER